MKIIEKKELLYLLALAAAGYFVFFNDLGRFPLQMWDESRNAVNALEMYFNKNFLVPHFEGRPEMWSTKPPLLIWIQVICLKIFGINEFAVRFPSALAGLTLVFYLYYFCRKHLKNPTAGFFSGLVLMTSVGFVHTHVARHADYDAPLTLFVFLYATQIFLYFERRQKKNIWLAALFLACAILTKAIAALLAGPGIFIAFMAAREHRKQVFHLRTILPLLAGLAVALSYYPLREIYNEGYIKAVIEQEITGRFGAVNEGHEGPPTFYLRNLRNQYFTAWLYFLPLAVLLTELSADRRVKLAGRFCSIAAAVFLLVISSSKTKIEWYDAQLYPFLALLLGITIERLSRKLLELSPEAGWQRTLLSFFFLLAIFAMPVHFLTKSSVVARNVNVHPTIRYGSYLREFFSLYPNNKRVYAHTEEYNSSLRFYQLYYNSLGRDIQVKPWPYAYVPGDTLIVCGGYIREHIEEKYKADILHESGDNYTMVIRDLGGILGQPATDKQSALIMINYKMEKIRGDQAWMESIDKKARENGRSTEEQLRLDAAWVLRQDSLISDSLNKVIFN